MLHCIQAAIGSDYQARCIVQLLAVVEFTGFQHLNDQAWTSNSGIVKVLVPTCQVLDRGEEAGGADRIEVGDADSELTVHRCVALSEVLHDLCMVITEMRVVHAERSKNVRRRELAERLAADTLHD